MPLELVPASSWVNSTIRLQSAAATAFSNGVHLSLDAVPSPKRKFIEFVALLYCEGLLRSTERVALIARLSGLPDAEIFFSSTVLEPLPNQIRNYAMECGASVDAQASPSRSRSEVAKPPSAGAETQSAARVLEIAGQAPIRTLLRASSNRRVR